MSFRENQHRGILVAIEGADRVGKATQAAMLESALLAKHIPAKRQEIPYDDGVTHPEIYRMLRDGAVRTHPLIFQTLHGVNRRYFQAEILPTLMARNGVVILDRWSLSTRVYGEADGVSLEETNEILRGMIEPDLTVVLDGPAHPKENLDVLEADAMYQEKVRVLYRRWCTSEPHDIVKIDAARDRYEVHADIFSHVYARLTR